MDQEATSSTSASPSSPVITIILTDSTHYPSPPKNTKYEVSPTLTGQQFRDKLAEELGYPKDSFEIKVRQQLIESGEERTIAALGVANKAFVTISRRNGTKEEDFKIKRIASDIQIPSTTSTSTALVAYGPQNNNNYGNSGYTSGYNSSYTSSWSYPTKTAGRSSSGFVGLSNQGATCYMNSLIQTLYMTPEFRQAVYKWSFDEKYKRSKEEKEQKEQKEQNGKGSNDTQAASSSSNTDRAEKEKVSIPLQLQRLFARLQLLDQQAVKTKDLTKSFGWEDADAFTQHDVQELCRVLFDALEKNFKGTEQANIVNELYQGKMKDYVQCKECNNESARTDDYLDIPLVIRGFGETTAVSSVEEALQKFVTPEILDKDNQYNCEKCGKKVDAVKGLKFVSFPYLLALQLKRFDFDYTTMRRIKLNDRVTFPHYLDLNSFIYGDAKTDNNNNSTTAASSDPEDLVEEDGMEGDSTEDISDDELMSSGSSNGKKQKKSNGHNGVNGTHAPAEPDFEGPPTVLPTAERPYVYELYSVLIHKGSTMGGHYYAYIKSFETKKWYEFNDSIVTEINPSEIKKAFGGDDDPPYPGYSSMYKSAFKSTSNAYMLMYRKVDPEKNLVKVPEADVPQGSKEIIDSETQQQKDKRDVAQREKEMSKFKIYYPQGSATKDPVGKELSVHKSTTLEETTKQAAALFDLTEKWNAVGLSGVRLRGYQPHNDLPTNTYTGQEQKTLDDLNLFGSSTYNPKNMMIETREANDEPFVDYNISDVLFRVAKFDTETNTFSPFTNINVPRSQNILAVKQAIEERLGIPINKQRILKEAYASMWSISNPVEIVELPDDYGLRGPKVSEPEKYFVEYCEEPLTEETTPGQAELVRLKNLIEVKFNIPDKEGTEGSVLVDKNTTLKEFRDKIAPVLGLGVDEFKIKRGLPPAPAFELVGDLDTLSDNNIRDGFALTIEKGKPLKEGEVVYTLVLLELDKDADNITDLFEVTIDENSLVSDVKKVLAVKLRDELQKRRNEKKIIGPALEHEANGADDDEVPIINPEYLRLREVASPSNSKKIGKALPNDSTLKKVMATSRRMAVQILPEPETVTDDDLILFVSQFSPSTFAVSRKDDFVISGEATVDQFKAGLAKKYNIPEENLSLARVDMFFGFYDDPEPLEIPKFAWDKHQGSKSLNESYYRNGYLFLVKDNSEPLKELTKEEHDAIEKETKKRAAMQLQYSGLGQYSGWSRKEKALKIHTTE